MASVAAGTYEVDPISRIEGHLGVKVTVGGGGTITEADAHGNLWRGFENFLIGRDANDAITITQRICGVCPLPHASAATFAADGVLGVTNGYISFDTSGTDGVPPMARLIRNLVYAAEFVMSHLTHFYHLAAPSYVQGPAMPPWTPYYANSQYNDLLESAGRAVPDGDPASTTTNNIWSAVIRQYVVALRMRRLTFEAGALFAGRMPMVSSFVAGGVSNRFRNRTDFFAKCDAFRDLMEEVGRFVIKAHVPLVLSLAYFYPEYDNSGNSWGPAPKTAGLNYGAGCKNLLSWGAFPKGGIASSTGLDVEGGYKIGSNPTVMFMRNRGQIGAAKALVESNLVEFITRSRYAPTDGFAGTVTEEVTLSGVSPSTLSSFPADVTAGSIVVKRRGSTTTYTLGSDYTVGVGTITRVAAGRIADGETVLVTYSYDRGGKAYPGDVNRTEPVRNDATKYSWLKAPRWWDGSAYQPMEVGPFARMVINGKYPIGTAIVSGAYAALYTRSGPPLGLDPAAIDSDLANALLSQGVVTVTGGSIVDTGVHTLVADLVAMKGGYSVMDRLRGRAIEAFWLITWMCGAFHKTTGNFARDGWISQLRALWTGGEDAVANHPASYRPVVVPSGSNSSMGVSEAPRGALAHFVTAAGGRITAYQCVVPTTWNASPKDGQTTPKAGPMEQAMIGVPFEDAPVNGRNSGVEVLRVAQSFDPCIACAVH